MQEKDVNDAAPAPAPDPDSFLGPAFSMWEKPRLMAASMALQRLRDAAEEEGTLVSDLETVGRIRRGYGLDRLVIKGDPAEFSEIALRTGLVVRPAKARGRGRPKSVVLGPVDDPSIK